MPDLVQYFKVVFTNSFIRSEALPHYFHGLWLLFVFMSNSCTPLSAHCAKQNGQTEDKRKSISLKENISSVWTLSNSDMFRNRKTSNKNPALDVRDAPVNSCISLSSTEQRKTFKSSPASVSGRRMDQMLKSEWIWCACGWLVGPNAGYLIILSEVKICTLRTGHLLTISFWAYHLNVS